MQYNIKYIRSNVAFLLPYLFIIIVFTAVFLVVPKNDLHLFINKYHSPVIDFIFKYLTYLGNGIIPFILALIVVFFSFRNALQLATAGTLAGLITQFFKRIVFTNMPRPFGVFKHLPEFHVVEGIKMHSSYSFPSGHAATIFAVCFIIVCITENKLLKFLLFLIALIIAFSRVYLSQHFLVDIYAGSLIGIVCGYIIMIILDRSNAKWLDSSLLKVIKKVPKDE